MKKILSVIMAIMVIVGCVCMTGCTEADNVNHNLSQAASFQVVRHFIEGLMEDC